MNIYCFRLSKGRKAWSAGTCLGLTDKPSISHFSQKAIEVDDFINKYGNFMRLFSIFSCLFLKLFFTSKAELHKKCCLHLLFIFCRVKIVTFFQSKKKCIIFLCMASLVNIYYYKSFINLIN